MSEKLTKIVEYYINTVDSQGVFKEKLIDDFVSEIRQEIVEEEKDEILSKSKEMQVKRQLKMKIAEAKEVTIVAIIIGFLVGLTVNQLTDLISILKPCQIEYVIIVDLCFVGIFLLLIWWAFKYFYIDKISKIVEEHYKK